MYFKIIFALALMQIAAAQLTGDCGRCLCEMQTGCNIKHPQGPYKISWPFWADSGRPTVNDEDPMSETAYKNCVANEKCSFEAVKTYLRNFEQDCDGDGDVDCRDYANILIFGGYGCVGKLPAHLQKRFDECYTGP